MERFVEFKQKFLVSLIIFCFKNGFPNTFFVSIDVWGGPDALLTHIYFTSSPQYIIYINAGLRDRFDVFNVHWALWVGMGLDGPRSRTWKRALNLIFCQTYKMFIVNIKFIQTSISTIVMTIRDRRIHFEHKHKNTKKKIIH